MSLHNRWMIWGSMTCLLAALAAAPALAAPTLAAPTQGVPTRIDNVYGGTAHEPDPASTIARERSAGVTGGAQAERDRTDTVEELARQIEHDAQTPTNFGCAPDATRCMQ